MHGKGVSPLESQLQNVSARHAWANIACGEASKELTVRYRFQLRRCQNVETSDVSGKIFDKDYCGGRL
jgi:hypothetical protein